MDREAVAAQFGRNVWLHRRRAGLRQSDVAEVAAMHRTEVGMLERGERVPRLDTLLKISGGLGVAPRELLAGLEWLPGHYVAGDFHVEDGSGWAVRFRGGSG